MFGWPTGYSAYLFTHGYKLVKSTYLTCSSSCVWYFSLLALVRPPKKLSRGVQPFCQIQFVHKVFHLWIFVHLVSKFMFPDACVFHTQSFNVTLFLLGEGVQFLQRLFGQGVYPLLSVLRETLWASMKCTSMELIGCVGGFTISSSLYRVPSRLFSPLFKAC